MAFQFNHSSDTLKTDGNPGYSFHLVSATTTNATATTLSSKYGDAISAPTSAFVTYSGTICAVEPATGNWKTWQIQPQGMANLGGIIGGLLGVNSTSQTNSTLATSSWNVTSSVDANNNLVFSVTGAAGKTLKWGGRLIVLRIDMSA